MVRHYNNVSSLGATVALAILLLAASAHAGTLTVCQTCNYNGIQSAVDKALPGDVIEVQSGTYYESLNITKPLRLKGIDSGHGRPVIECSGKGPVITLSVDGISVEGLIIRCPGSKDTGIMVVSQGNTISKNEISNLGKDGVLLEHAGSNLIADNLLAYNGRNGIYLKDSNNNIIQNNTASFNSNSGFFLERSSSNTLEKNAASKNRDGIYLEKSGNNVLRQNDIKSNSRDGIALEESHANLLVANNASYDYNGIRLMSSTENRAQENFAGYNKQNGIRLVSSAGNMLSSNALVDNSLDAYDDGYDNQWYDATSRRGSYYSDNVECSDQDGDSVCDKAYSIKGGRGQDLYPLAGQDQEGILFIEIWRSEWGELVEGTPVSMMIDFPMYRLQNSTLHSVYEVDLRSAALAVVGSGTSLAGDLGGGASSSLYAVDKLPYLVDNVTLLSLQGDQATVRFLGQQRTLQPGESWQEESQEMRIEEDAKLRVTVSCQIVNHGRVRLQPGGLR